MVNPATALEASPCSKVGFNVGLTAFKAPAVALDIAPNMVSMYFTEETNWNSRLTDNHRKEMDRAVLVLTPRLKKIDGKSDVIYQLIKILRMFEKHKKSLPIFFF